MKIILTTIISFLSLFVSAQTNVESFLELVASNNSEILAAKKLAEAERISFQTEISLDNPSVEYGYFPGDNPSIGNKSVYGISQSIEFPTIYGIKKKIANQQGILSDLEFQLFKQDKLLQAKLRFYDYIFMMKKEAEGRMRLVHAEKLLLSYNKQFENGNASILDLNKARIQFLNIKSGYQLLKQDLQNIRKELALYCGIELPNEISPVYPTSELRPVNIVISEVQQLQPELKYLNKNQIIAQMQIKLAKQNWLPDLEIGYQSEVEQDGTYRGLKAGISLPLWNDRNKVKHAEAQTSYMKSHLDTRRLTIINETEKRYSRVQEYAKILNEYESTLKQSANIGFLDKALEMGQLSVIEYFNELSFYYQTMDKLLEIELEYYKTWGELESYKL